MRVPLQLRTAVHCVSRLQRLSVHLRWLAAPHGVGRDASPLGQADHLVRTNILRWLRNLCGWLGLLMLLVTFTPFTTWFAHRLADQWADRAGETVIVLTAGEAEDGFLTESSVIRAQMLASGYIAEEAGIGVGMRSPN